MNEPSDVRTETLYDDEGHLLGFNVIMEEKGGFQRGKVTLFNGPGEEDDISYEWKYSEGKYWILVDGEWVPVEDPEWKPGMPLPS